MPVFLKIVLPVLFITAFGIGAKAQDNNCSGKLDSARMLFNNGLIENLPATLLPCIEEGFSREERISAYKLLVLTYLFDDNQLEAEKTMSQFIFDYPNYDIRPDDPVEFVYLFDSFESIPKYSFGLRAGTNIAQPYHQNPQTVGISGSNKTKIRLGSQMAFVSTVFFTRSLGLNIEFEIFQTNHEFVNFVDGISEVSFQESQNWLEIPFYASYQYPLKSFKPYAFLGSSFSFLLSAKGLPVRTIPDPVNNQVLSGPELDISSQRKQFGVLALAGIGVQYPLVKGSIFFDFRVNLGMFNHFTGNRFETPSLWSDYYHLDNDFALVRYAFSIGYVYSIYTPEKVR